MSTTDLSHVASVHGLTAHVDAAVISTDGAARRIVFLSLIGSSVAVTGIWAGLIAGADVHVAGHSCERWIREDGALPSYRIFRRPLPRFGKVHTIMTTEDAVPSLAAIGRDFFIVSHTDEAADIRLARFKSAWDRAVTVPALDNWTSVLVKRGQTAGLMTSAETIGPCRAARVIADNARWTDIVRQIAHETGRSRPAKSTERRIAVRREATTSRPQRPRNAAGEPDRRTTKERRLS